MGYEFADRLIELRKAHGLGQEELAQRIGLSRQAISKWERAESSPDIGNLVVLAELYEVSIDELVKGASAAEAVDAADVAGDADAASADDGEQEAEAVEAAVAGDASAAEDVPAAEEGVPAKPAPTMPPPDPAQRVDWEGATATACGCEPDDATQAPPPGHPFGGHRADPAARQGGKPSALTFPYPVLCAALYLVMGFVFGLWHPCWVIFLTIPFYYWIVNVVAHDANYQARHGSFDE